MLLDILLILIGVVLVIWGADRMTDGAVSIAQRLKIPKIVIGLTIVAMGTSAPEFFVSLMSALKGTPDLAVGNVVGSNIFNILFALGPCAVIRPLSMEGLKQVGIGYFIGSVLLLFALSLHKGQIGRVKGAVLMLAYLVYVFLLLTH